MNLAAILLVCFLGLGDPTAGSQAEARESAAQDRNNTAMPQSQPSPAQSANPEPSSAAPAGQPQNSPGPAKPSPKRQGHHKKTSIPDCSNAATALNPAGVSGPDVATPAGATSGGSTGAQSTQGGATNSAPAAAKPCPPPKVVIKNGGSDEPTVELKGNGSAEQAAQQRFITEQLTTATEENLKKLSGQLDPSQQQTLNQIKQFMEQAKSALAAEDLGRAHNLAMKAHLLSDELVKH